MMGGEEEEEGGEEEEEREREREREREKDIKTARRGNIRNRVNKKQIK